MRGMTVSKDVGTRGQHHFYFRNGTLDFYVGWLLGYSQLGGASPGAIYHALNRIRPGDPRSWVAAFTELADLHQGYAESSASDTAIAAHHHLTAACAARAALHLADPASGLVQRMEHCFQAAMTAQAQPLVPWRIPFQEASLPAYVSTGLHEADALVVVVGGGDTYREDLWFFGGQAALAHRYAVLLVDLPGQGSTPDQGLHFGPQTVAALDTAIRAARERGHTGRTILLGWSGGGLFTAKYIETFGNVDAWIASTPICDMARVFEQALPTVFRRRPGGAPQRLLMRAAGRLNPVLAATLDKYDRQFGPGGIAAAVDQFRSVGTVNLDKLDTPLLALVGTGEDTELRRQARQVHETVVRRHPQSRLVEFSPASGADSHCQVNNLPLALAHVFSWLAQLGYTPRTGQA